MSSQPTQDELRIIALAEAKQDKRPAAISASDPEGWVIPQQGLPLGAGLEKYSKAEAAVLNQPIVGFSKVEVLCLNLDRARWASRPQEDR